MRCTEVRCDASDGRTPAGYLVLKTPFLQGARDQDHAQHPAREQMLPKGPAAEVRDVRRVFPSPLVRCPSADLEA